ncbi:acylneuraminate cytidylyltransferase family protein [Eubacteriales bacterium OttesenSCG-928-A19]|nr:acylneuraminate cytidylyltransferase family protein [Eubacteriales bacterium OttesenSCG-928-A19]
MSTKALIAARSGSVRVKNKNLREFAGKNLLVLKIEQLLRIPELDGVVVNSNDDQMLRIAHDLGAETVKRNEFYASNTVSMSDVYKNMAENFPGDVIVYTNCTNPLLKDETLSRAIHVYNENAYAYDSLNSAHEIKEFLFKDGKPLNYDLLNQPRSQDLPDIYALNFAISIISKKNMIRCKNVVGMDPFIFPIDAYEGIDIDNEIDFEFAEFAYSKR